VHKGGGSRKITVWVENTRSYVKKKITKTKRAVGVAQVVERLVIKKKKRRSSLGGTKCIPSTKK
jgi:hypothetical protein